MKKLFLPLAVFSIIASSCEPATPTAPPVSSTSTVTPYTTDTNDIAVMVSANVYTTQTINVPILGEQIIDVNVPTAYAVFAPNSNFSSSVNAGDVSFNSLALTIQSNNSYIYQFDENNTTLYSGSGQTWNISGNVGNGIPAHSFNVPETHPQFSGTSSFPSTISKGGSITVNVGSTVYCDSLMIFIVDVNNNKVQKSVSAAFGASSITFNSSELSILQNTDYGAIAAVAYNYQIETLAGKDWVYVQTAQRVNTGVKIQD